jgi:hypothetical protein
LSLIVWAGTDDHALTDDRAGSPAHRRGQARTRPAPAYAFADPQLARLSSLEPEGSNEVALPM